MEINCQIDIIFNNTYEKIYSKCFISIIKYNIIDLIIDFHNLIT